MRVKEIEALFESEETLDKVLDEHKEDFEKIDYWDNLLKSGVVNNPVEINKALAELAGCYSNLNITLGVAEYKKKNREVRYYNQLRIDKENLGDNKKKFVSAVAEKEASAHVANYRRIRNIIRAYKESADKSITTLQNINNNLDKEYKKHPSG